MRINNVRLFGQFQDCKAFTDQSIRLEPGHIWRESGKWYLGTFVMDGATSINVRVEHDYYEHSPELFEQCQDRVIEGILRMEISRGTGVVSHWVEITKCSLVLAPIGKPVEQPMNDYIIINLIKTGADGRRRMDNNVAELTVCQYRVDTLGKEIVFRHNPQGKSCSVSYESLEIKAGVGPGRFLLVHMTEAQFNAYRELWRDR